MESVRAECVRDDRIRSGIDIVGMYSNDELRIIDIDIRTVCARRHSPLLQLRPESAVKHQELFT